MNARKKAVAPSVAKPQQGKAPARSPQKGVKIAILVISGVVLVLFIWAAEISNQIQRDSGSASSSASSQPALRVVTWQVGHEGGFDHTCVYGVAENASGETLPLAGVEFAFHDSNGAQTETESATTDNLPPGQTWDFKVCSLNAAFGPVTLVGHFPK